MSLVMLNEYKETYVLNFFFGEVKKKPITFVYTFKGLANNESNNSTILFELINTEEQFHIENDFRKFNSIGNRQNIGHNIHACAQTGHLRISYPSFHSEKSYEFTERIHDFLQFTVAYILTFFQRRRVVFGCPALTSGERQILAMPPFFAADYVDSVGYGEPLIGYDQTECCLNSVINKYEICDRDEQDKISMLLIRYNETLNLPYTYERVESFWRILESMSEAGLNDTVQLEYERLKTFIGVKDNSKALKKFVNTLMSYDINYTDELIDKSFKYRNKVIHEYLNISIIREPYLGEVFLFLNEAIEKVILSRIGLDCTHYRMPSFTLINNKVL